MDKVIPLNNRFEVKWNEYGASKVKIVTGLSDLSEFVRNSEVFDREIISIEACIG